MSNPRIIAVTASTALIAGVGAGAAVYAVGLATDSSVTETAAVQAEQSTRLQQPQDDKTTVYTSPSDDDDDDDDDDESGGTPAQIQPAPADTQWNSGSGKNNSNTSKSS